jgi:hypothetical protein
LCRGGDEGLEAFCVQIRQLQEEAIVRRGLHGIIDGEPFEDVLDRADGLHLTCGETAADCQ